MPIKPKLMTPEGLNEALTIVNNDFDSWCAHALEAHILALKERNDSLLSAVTKYKHKWMRLNRLSQIDETEKDKVIRLQRNTILRLSERSKRQQHHVKSAAKQVDIERARLLALQAQLAERDKRIGELEVELAQLRAVLNPCPPQANMADMLAKRKEPSHE